MSGSSTMHYGPHADLVLDFIKQCRQLAPAHIHALAEQPSLGPQNKEYDTALKAAGKLKIDKARRYAYFAVGDALKEALGDALVEDATTLVDETQVTPKLLRRAYDVAWDACSALMVRSLLPASDYTVLTDGWMTVMHVPLPS